jgi:ribonuclease Z
MQHRIPCCGYLFKEKPFLRNMRADKMMEYNIPPHLVHGIKLGYDYTMPDGRVIANTELTLDPIAPRSYAFCSDTIYHHDYVPIIQGCDTIYHETTFDRLNIARAGETFHCTAAQAANIAQAAAVKKMLMGHYSSKYEDIRIFESEARAIFPNSVATVEGMTYKIESA